ncbi:MAG: pre-peptidase C-terminal domain-containing protein [Telluria sp.]
MKFQSRILCSIALVMAALAPSFASADAKFIYLTRHAEKSATGTDPVLTPEGVTRANNIAATLKKSGITGIYSTNTVRTKQTAQPLSTILNLPVQTYDDTQLATFAAQLKALPGNTLVVGHSNTTPELIRLLSGDIVPAIAETEFDRLYQVAIGQDGDVTTTLMNSLPSASTGSCAAVTVNQPNLSAATNTWLYFTITVPECANTLTVKTSGGTGDADLYVRFNARPTSADATCRSTNSANTESCVVPNPAAGVWHVGIFAYNKPIAGVTLNASATP